MEDLDHALYAAFEKLEDHNAQYPDERHFRRQFVRPLYEITANAGRHYERCEAECRRARRCCYLEREPKREDLDYFTRINLQVRFMPLCIARIADDELLENIRWFASHYLK